MYLLPGAGISEHELGLSIEVTTLAERPQLGGAMRTLSRAWPEFMTMDPVADLYFTHLERFHAEWVLVATPANDPSRVIARAYSVPFAYGPRAGRDRLPPDGWDRVIRWAFHDRAHGISPTAASALDITVDPEFLGQRLSGLMVEHLRENVRRYGFRDLFAPVRPTRKAQFPEVSMDTYLARTRDDGLPEDPWLRTHVRAGGTVVGVAPTSMTVTGTVQQWRRWTGLPFDRSGPVIAPGALAPVHCHLLEGYAAYVEPNVWVHHRIDDAAPEFLPTIDLGGA